jgi:predicted PurR-regulated permease PerM
MQVSRHINITGSTLKQWFVGQCYDSACVGLLWWGGLTALQVPWAPFWGVVAAMFQFIPQFGTVLSALGPLAAAMFVNWETVLYVLILYGAIVVIDGLVLQPLIMRRTARVPIWASLTIPILLSLIFGFWGLLLAAPILAVVFAYRAYAKNHPKPGVPQQTPPGQVITGGQLISPGEPARPIPQRGKTVQ